MKKEVVEEFKKFIDYLEEKVEECYKKEVKIMKKRFYERMGITEDGYKK